MSSLSPGLLDVLRHLSATEFVSGEALAQRLGLSRATIHNRLRTVQALGMTVFRVPGRGYRLAQPVSWLNEGELNRGLSGQGFQLRLEDSVDSTNSRLLAQAAEGRVHKSVLVTEWQHGGRGRRGRTWLAPLGGGLTFSLLWRFHRPMAELSGLSLAVGLALARAARALGTAEGRPDWAEGVRVKWPNDLLHDRAKLAGILIEVQGDALGPSVAVIGVGLNVHLSEAAKASIDQPAADLASGLGRAPDRNALLCLVLAHLDRVLHHFDATGFAGLRPDWEALHAYQDREVRMTGLHGDVHGRVLGVDADGALLLETPGGVRRMLSGEVSLRESSP